jgi:hypothetical protein
LRFYADFWDELLLRMAKKLDLDEWKEEEAAEQEEGKEEKKQRGRES